MTGEPMEPCGRMRLSDHIASQLGLETPPANLPALHEVLNAGMPPPRCTSVPSATAYSLAFPCMAYVTEISRYCEAHAIEHIYFLSREGLFFKRLFEAMGLPGPQTSYLSISRISIYLLSINALDETAIVRMLDLFANHSHLPNVSFRQLLSILKIDTAGAARIVRSHGYNWRRPMPLAESRKAIMTVLLDERLRQLFAATRARYLELFMDYLRTMQLTSHRRVLVCDVGWSGSMQSYLAELLKAHDPAIELHGLYLGYDQTIDEKKNGKPSAASPKTGYFTYTGQASQLQEQQIINNLSLETLTSAGHGTVVTYERRGTHVIPVYRHIPEEVWQFRRSIGPFQDLVIAYAQRYANLFCELQRAYPAGELYAYNRALAYDLFHKPTDACKHFMAFVFYDDFFGRNTRIRLAPFVPPGWRAFIRFGVRGVAARLCLHLLPQGLLKQFATTGEEPQ